jgi:hypothetical protein
MSANAEAGLPSVADVLMQTTVVEATLDVCCRLVLSPDDQSLLRVINQPTGRVPQIENLRGQRLIEVRANGTSTPISARAGQTLDHLIDLLYSSGAARDLEDEPISLVFQRPKPDEMPNREAELRAKRNLVIHAPGEPTTELSTQTLLLHLAQRPSGLLGGGRPRFIRDLAQIPSGSCFHFSHPHWTLNGLGALARLPASKVRELDLSDNALTSVGDSLSRFEQLVDLRLAGNAIDDIALHYLPRLKHLDLHCNRLTVCVRARANMRRPPRRPRGRRRRED